MRKRLICEEKCYKTLRKEIIVIFCTSIREHFLDYNYRFGYGENEKKILQEMLVYKDIKLESVYLLKD